ncbi:hypothetical protein [Sphingobium sp.]|uniref:hypothetical protein n=1 Tax=Sphingobium sp. TaxID=1912891 RepID=UPI003BB80648
MMARQHRAEGRGAHVAIAAVPWALTLWMLIAVALLSALAPLGPPLSRVTGSAFNPATSDVVLKVRALPAAQVAQPTRPDGDGDSHVAPFVALVSAVLVFLLCFRVPVQAFRSVSSPRLARRRDGAKCARAPPLPF